VRKELGTTLSHAKAVGSGPVSAWAVSLGDEVCFLLGSCSSLDGQLGQEIMPPSSAIEDLQRWASWERPYNARRYLDLTSQVARQRQ
jgi:hypothetical protein